MIFSKVFTSGPFHEIQAKQKYRSWKNVWNLASCIEITFVPRILGFINQRQKLNVLQRKKKQVENIPSSCSSDCSANFLLCAAFFDLSLHFFTRGVGHFWTISLVVNLQVECSDNRLLFLVLGISVCSMWFEFYPCGLFGLLLW